MTKEMTTAERTDAIVGSKRRGNHPCKNGEDGKRLVGWIVDQDIAGMSEALFVVEEIERRLAERDTLLKQLVSLRSETIEQCAKIVEDFPYQMLHMWERPGGPPGNGYRETTHEDISAAVRALIKQTDELVKP